MDWAGLMRAGLGGLHLLPRDFWALTPIELQMMLGLVGNEAPLGRGRLVALLEAFPDEPKDKGDG